MRSLADLSPPSWRKRHNVVSICACISVLVFIVIFYQHAQSTNYTWAPVDSTSTTDTTSSSTSAAVATTTGNNNKNSNSNNSPSVAPLLSDKIWQIWFQQEGAAERYVPDPKLRETATWIGMNPDHQYRLVGRDWGDEFVRKNFDYDQELVDTYLGLKNFGMKSDLLRYMLLYMEGGVYTDIDTIALKPIHYWVPESLRDQVRLVVGIEFDRRDGGRWAEIPHDLQFCQWTIAAAPHHPAFKAMIDRSMASIKELTTVHETSVVQLEPTSFETMNSTGPAAWTDIIFDQIHQAVPEITTVTNLSNMHEPRLFGDILVLNIDGFGMGQTHSGATHDGSIPDAAMLQHLFRGGWRNHS